MRARPRPNEVHSLRRRLLRWWRGEIFTYPWRDTGNEWLGLVAEILLQRTRATQVVPVYERFALQYPSPQVFLTAASAAAVTETLGLHARANHLRAAAQAIVVTPHAARVKLLRNVKGIGPYTWAAWLSLHAGRRAVIVDANVYRWLARLTGRNFRRDPRAVRWVNECADALTPRRMFREYNYAVLDFTMTICKPRVPRCDGCVLRSMCVWGRRLRSMPPTPPAVR